MWNDDATCLVKRGFSTKPLEFPAFCSLRKKEKTSVNTPSLPQKRLFKPFCKTMPRNLKAFRLFAEAQKSKCPYKFQVSIYFLRNMVLSFQKHPFRFWLPNCQANRFFKGRRKFEGRAQGQFCYRKPKKAFSFWSLSWDERSDAFLRHALLFSSPSLLSISDDDDMVRWWYRSGFPFASNIHKSSLWPDSGVEQKQQMWTNAQQLQHGSWTINPRHKGSTCSAICIGQRNCWSVIF